MMLVVILYWLVTLGCYASPRINKKKKAITPPGIKSAAPSRTTLLYFVY